MAITSPSSIASARVHQFWPVAAGVVLLAATVVAASARVHQFWPVAAGVVLLAATVVAAIVPAQTLWCAWASACRLDWNAYWAWVVPFPQFALFVSFFVGQAALHFSLAAASLNAIRRRALMGDDQTLPVAVAQPRLLDTAELPPEATVLGPFDRVKRVVETPACLITFITAICGSELLLVAIAALVASFIPAEGEFAGHLRWFGAGLILLGAALLYVDRRLRRRVHARWGPRMLVTPSGLSWGRRVSRRTSMDWNEAHAFWHLASEWRGNMDGREAYVLEGARNTLVWYVSHEGSRPDQVAQHHVLCRLIVTRTGLPLRDYSAAAEAIANAQRAGGQAGVVLLRGEHPAISAEAARAIIKPRLPASGWPVVIAVFALVVTELVVFIGGWLTQHFLAR